MTRLISTWLCVLVLLTSAAHAAPSAVYTSYNVMRNGLHVAVINERYETHDNTYSISSDSAAIGLFALAQRNTIAVTSRGEVTRAGLRPLHFEARRGSNEARRVSADFDWKAEKLAMHFDGRTESTALPAGTQDRLSIMYHFMHMNPAKMRTVEFSMTNGRKIDRYRYSVAPDVTIDTPYRRLVTTHLVKQREPGETATEIWLAPELNFVTAKLLIVEDDGVRYEQLLTRLEVKP